MEINFLSLIRKKRDGLELTKKEIEFFIKNLINKKIPDYQASAFLMAIYFQGLNFKEITNLTLAMMKSGKIFKFKEKYVVDKHSTGGVGDKVSLILTPILAALGFKIPMIAGKSLGHTGGTIDKLSSIPNFKTKLTYEECKEAIENIGFFIAKQTEDLVSADKYLYSLRDATSTIESIPLITASIMSKKLAEGINFLLLDIKTGNGAFLEKFAEAKKLAETIIKIGRLIKKKISVFITDMNQPLGKAIGNSLEVIEAIEFLKGDQLVDLKEIVFTFAKEFLLRTKLIKSEERLEELLNKLIKEGKPLRKFQEMIKNQGGEEAIIENYNLLPKAKYQEYYLAPQKGYIFYIDTKKIGFLCNFLGGGRTKIEDEIDYSVGFIFAKKLGEKVERGEPILEIHANDKEKLKEVKRRLKEVILIKEEGPKLPSLIYWYGRT
ncbi:MAG: thymidine phosphorylase [candidate division WOR-3 bacterium]